MAHFSLLQSSLKLQLLGIQLLPDLLQLMDGLLAGAQLLCEVRDLLCPGQIPSDHMEVVENKAGRERTKNYRGRIMVSPWRFLFSLLKVSRCSSDSS